MKLTRLRTIRLEHALTQKDLATLTGLSSVTIARIELGESDPFPTTVRKLAHALGVRPVELWESNEKKLGAGTSAA